MAQCVAWRDGRRSALYDRRWPILSKFRSGVAKLFVSYEPAIGPMLPAHNEDMPDWIICGGESGPGEE
jgi:protein gp37